MMPGRLQRHWTASGLTTCTQPRLRRFDAVHGLAVVVVLVATLMIAACAGSSEVKVGSASNNALGKAAQNMERRASQDFSKNEFDSAAAGYESAALVYETLALPEPQARARLSQARALAEAGRTREALEMIGTLLQNPAGLSAEVMTTAHGRAAALSLDRDLPRAQTHLQSAMLACANTCAQRSALGVLRARTELAVNNPTGAVASASAALAAAQNSNDRANALRARAQANAALSQHAQVLLDAQQALALDQDLGLPPRVLADLVLLQRASLALGDATASARYGALAQRAIAAGAALRSEAAR